MTDQQFVLFAPNIHTGGGRVLLQALLDSWPADRTLKAVLDMRAQTTLKLPERATVHWVRPRVLSRLEGEFALRAMSQGSSGVLCFHGLPPLLRPASPVVVFLQNHIYLGLTPLRAFRPSTAVRLAFERAVGWLLRGRVARYIVQTPTMARDLTAWFGTEPQGRTPPIDVLPFAQRLPPMPDAHTGTAAWDFVYVADGEAHKNHGVLLEAWVELARQGLRPRLALTLSTRDEALARQVQALRAEHGVDIHNLGQMPHADVLTLYRTARAVVFPSLTESFGLPLVEAMSLGVPIVAAELDYVRDVCVPVQTFDPRSPRSLARAVRRFLQQPQTPVAIVEPAALWRRLDELTGGRAMAAGQAQPHADTLQRGDVR